MGNSNARKDPNFHIEQWEEVENQEQYNGDGDSRTVVRNKQTGQLLDRYSLRFPPNEKEYEEYIDSVRYRMNEANIVRVVHYESKVLKEFCGATYMLDVYIEHCQSRLSDYEDIPYPDYLYCSMAMLDGYKKLFEKIGRFQVSERQVMIDEEGEVRVWLNEDFCENQAQDIPTTFYNNRNLHDKEYEMVDDIMKMVFDNLDEAEGPKINLVDFYEREKNNMDGQVGFEEAKNIVIEYSRINNVEIPQLFRSVYEIYQNDENRHHDNNNDDLFRDQGGDRSLDRNERVGSGMPNHYYAHEGRENINQSQVQSNVGANNFVRSESHPHLSQGPVELVPQLAQVQRLPIPVPIQTGQANIHTGPAYAQLQGNNLILNRPQTVFNQSSGVGIIKIPPPTHQPIPNFQHGQAGHFKQFPIIQNQPFFIPPNHHHPHQIQHQHQPFSSHSLHPQPHLKSHSQPHFSGHQQYPQVINRGPVPINQIPINVPIQAQTYPHIQNLEQRKIAQNHDNRKHQDIGEEELEIEKKLFLKESGNGDDFVNEANIIKELSEFHRKEQDEQSKRSHEDPEIIQDDDDRNFIQRDSNDYGYHHQINHSSLEEQEVQYKPPTIIKQAVSYGTFQRPPIPERRVSQPERQLYYTLDSEMELDPEIAADIAAFMRA